MADAARDVPARSGCGAARIYGAEPICRRVPAAGLDSVRARYLLSIDRAGLRECARRGEDGQGGVRISALASLRAEHSAALRSHPGLQPGERELSAVVPAGAARADRR